MDNKIEIVDKYEKLLRIKKVIVVLSFLIGLFILVGLSLRKVKCYIMSNIFLCISAISIILVVVFCSSVKPIQKNILSMIDRK